jgi:hypothetical protein
VTNTTTIGKALASLLGSPSLLTEAKNRYIYLASHTVTQAELLGALENGSRETWTVEHIDAAAFVRRGGLLRSQWLDPRAGSRGD